jgi:CBS domain-containing protein
MFEQSVRSVMRRRDLLTAPPSISVIDAAGRMAKKNVGAIVVIENEQIVGIFTERDIVFRVVARGLDVATTRISDAMTRTLHTIQADESFGCALLVMHDHKFRHLPVLDDGKLVGIVSARSALDPELEDFVFEAERRAHLRAEHARRTDTAPPEKPKRSRAKLTRL